LEKESIQGYVVIARCPDCGTSIEIEKSTWENIR